MTDERRVGAVLAAAFAAAAVNAAFLPLWFADRGLSTAEIGLVLGGASAIRVVGGPLGGWAADRLGRRRAVIALAAAGAACCAVILPWVHGVLPLLILTAMLGVAVALLSPLVDALTLALAAESRLDYGRTRAWGSVSFMVATAAAGAVLTRLGSSLVPAILATGYATAAMLARALPDVASSPRRVGSPVALLRDRGFLLAVGATALIQGSHAAYYAFAPLHWRAAGLSDAVIGLLVAEGIVAEIVLFVRGRALVRRLGPARLTGIAAGACLLRWTAMAFVVDVPTLAVLQLLHAATFATQHLSTMLVLSRLAPERAGMAQTLTAALGFSASTAALVWFTGQVYGAWGGLAFLPMAAVGGSALLLVRPLARTMAAAG